MALHAAKLHMDTQEKKYLADGSQLFVKVALRSSVIHRAFFASGPPNRLRSRPPKSRNSAALPATPGPAPRRLVLHRPFTRTLPFLQGSCNPIRLLEAAELLEADQRKHEGGQSKETSSVLDSTSFGSVPMIFWSRRLVARPNRPWLSKLMIF